MMTTFKVACNDDEVVVLHSGLEGYIKSKCSFIACLFVCLFVWMLLKCVYKGGKIMFVMSSSSFMMSTLKVACNDDEVVVMHSGLEGIWNQIVLV